MQIYSYHDKITGREDGWITKAKWMQPEFQSKSDIMYWQEEALEGQIRDGFHNKQFSSLILKLNRFLYAKLSIIFNCNLLKNSSFILIFLIFILCSWRNKIIYIPSLNYCYFSEQIACNNLISHDFTNLYKSTRNVMFYHLIIELGVDGFMFLKK